jgi:hypothetical protein
MNPIQVLLKLTNMPLHRPVDFMVSPLHDEKATFLSVSLSLLYYFVHFNQKATQFILVIVVPTISL